MVNFFKAHLIKGVLRGLAKSSDTQTTVLGLVAAGLLASGIDWNKLVQGDPDQIGLLVGTVVAILFGYLTNKPDKNKKK